MEAATKANGVIKFWKSDKGYGFIQRDGGGDDVFVHVSAFTESGLGEPERGGRYKFEIGEGRDGKTRAVKLAPLPADAESVP